MPIKFLNILFCFEIVFNFFKASFSERGSSILSSSFNKIFSGTVFFIKSSNELYPTSFSMISCSASVGPMWRYINSLELLSII